jgi:hypothetical protein
MITIEKHERREKQLVENPDGILVQQALAGNSDAFEKLVQHYSISLFNFILR